MIVGVTGNSLYEDLMHFEALGADVALVKPLKAGMLKSLLSYCDDWGVKSSTAQFSIVDTSSASKASQRGSSERRIKNWLLNEVH